MTVTVSPMAGEGRTGRQEEGTEARAQAPAQVSKTGRVRWAWPHVGNGHTEL